MTFEIDRQDGPTCITILPTYKCTAACANCCFGSHPWVRGRIPQDNIVKYISEAAEYKSLRLVVFSGGECFMLGDDLVSAIAYATSIGLATRCVTNGYWASSLEEARRRIEPLIMAGLTELSLSTGDQHARFVPIENIMYAMRSALEKRLGVATMIELSGERTITQASIREHPLFAELLSTFPSSQIHMDESPWISMDVGEDEVRYSDTQLLNRSNVDTRQSCTSVLDTIVVNPQEELYACCGITSQQIPELNLGKIKDHALTNMYDVARTDFMKIWLSVEGPEKILAWAASIDPNIDWENRFSHQCDACRFLHEDEKVATVIATCYEERVADILLTKSLITTR